MLKSTLKFGNYCLRVMFEKKKREKSLWHKVHKKGGGICSLGNEKGSRQAKDKAGLFTAFLSLLPWF